MTARFAFIAVLVAGCHGATIHEALPDGGGGDAGGGTGGGIAGTTGGGGRAGTGGAGGGAGRGGTTGAAGATGGRGGSAGAGCAAQMTPQMFYRGDLPPLFTAVTPNRFYWVEYNSPSLALHYTAGYPPAENKHMIQISSAPLNSYEITASDVRVAGLQAYNKELSVWGPDSGSTQIDEMTMASANAIAIDGPTIFYSVNAPGGSVTPGIYTWNPPAGPTLFESDAELGRDRTNGSLLRVTPTKLLLSDYADVWFVDRAAKGPRTLLFANPTTRVIQEVRPARGLTTEGPVIVQLDDPIVLSGRDYYVNLTQPTAAPKDLGTATTILAGASACGSAANYNGVGVQYKQRYIYEGDGGLFAVDIAADGGVSNLVRLTDTPFSYPEVTESGDLFAGTLATGSSRWDYYRIGKL